MTTTRIYEVSDITKLTNNIYNPKKAYESLNYTKVQSSPSSSLFELLGEILAPKKKETPKVKKTTEDKIGSFVVNVDSSELAWSLIDLSIDLGLTVAGDGRYGMKTKYPIGKIREGNLLEFFGSNMFDVDWIKNPEYSVSQNFVPVYTLSDDYFTIVDRIKKVAKEKKQLAKEIKLPTQPTYRMLKQASVAVEEREGLAEKKADKCSCIPTDVRVTKVRVTPHFFEVDGDVYTKSTNSKIYFL